MWYFYRYVLYVLNRISYHHSHSGLFSVLSLVRREHKEKKNYSISITHFQQCNFINSMSSKGVITCTPYAYKWYGNFPLNIIPRFSVKLMDFLYVHFLIAWNKNFLSDISFHMTYSLSCYLRSDTWAILFSGPCPLYDTSGGRGKLLCWELLKCAWES